MVVRLQAAVRGLKARKYVKEVYGFQVKPSMMHRKTVALSPSVIA
jgi:hypothetical protein